MGVLRGQINDRRILSEAPGTGKKDESNQNLHGGQCDAIVFSMQLHLQVDFRQSILAQAGGSNIPSIQINLYFFVF